MFDFYHMPSGCSVAVKAALSLTGKDYNLIPENMQDKSAALIDANPLGKVPTLVVDGQPLFEGGAINLWLALNNPETALMPADLASLEGAEALKWLFYAYATLNPNWGKMFLPMVITSQDAKAEVSAKTTKDLMDTYGVIADQLAKHDYVAGEKLTLADLYIAATIHWENHLGIPVTETYPALAAHRDRVVNTPGVREAFAGEFGYE